ncbi:MAG: hypothetical protein V2I35_03415 [Desulfocapsaceae bacterium]|jgi:hypothetical protein|nr:hypothetical protein [Desulfocapsaceae bacterium]
MENHHRPLSLFGMPLKKLFAGIIFFSVLLAAINPSELKSLFTRVTTVQINSENGRTEQDASHIIATEEMISEAIKELKGNRIQTYEQPDGNSPTDRFFYAIELHDGGALQASSVSIEPDLVTVISQSGIKTILHRATIKKISRYKLPDITPPKQ